ATRRKAAAGTSAVTCFPRSDRGAITAQADRNGEEYRGDREADPQTRTAQKFSEVEVSQHQDAALHLASLRAAAHARSEHGAEMRSVEDHLLDDADRGER